MKQKILFTLLTLLLLNPLFGQDMGKYAELINEAYRLYNVKDFSNSAKL